MRWSLFSLVALFVVLIIDVIALPIPQDYPEPILERRSHVRASDFKKSSKTYRDATLKSTNPMLSINSGGVVASKAPKVMPVKMDADHIFEAQTMKVAVQRSGHTLTSLAPAMDEVKNRINDPKNMGFLDPATNRAKGRAHTAVLAGGAASTNPNVVDVLKMTSAAGKSTASDIDKILSKHGITGVNVLKTHEEVLRAHGVTRRTAK